jgi:tetratricopeptide (TPR) repeat protein
MLKKTAAVCLVLLFAGAACLAAAGSAKKKEPAEYAKLYNEGVDLMLKGEYAAAQARFEAAIAKKSDFAEAHNNLGYALRKQGHENWAAALDHYNHALELNPKLAEALMYRGVLFVLMGFEDKAKADHAALTELDPKLAEQLMQAIATGKEPEGSAGLAARWQPKS